MRSPSDPRTLTPARTAAYGVLVLGTLAVAFLLRYPSLYEPRWYGDEGIFAAVAQNIRHGHTLYAQAWDNKPPLVFFTYAAVQSRLGSGVFELHAVAMAVAMATQLCVMAVALVLFDGKRALAAGLLVAFALGTPLLEGNLAMTETFMVLPASLAVLVYVLAERRGRAGSPAYYGAAGVLIGVAAAYKQVAVFDGAAIGMMIWLRQERPHRPLAAMAAGFALPHAAFALFFLATGAFGQYWYAIAGSLGLYSDLGPAQSPFVRFSSFLPALLAAAWLVRRRQHGLDAPLRCFPVLWLGFAVAGATSSSFPFPHYLQQAVPPLALVLVSNPFVDERERTGRIALAAGGALAAALVFGQFSFAFQDRRQLDPVTYYRTFVSHQYGTMSDLDYDYYFDGKAVAVRDIVAYIDEDDGGRSVYTWSELPWIYAAGNLTNPTSYYTSFLGEVVPGAKRKIMADLDARPPAYIVVSDDAYAPFEELEEFLSEHYGLLRAENDWRLYRLSTVTGRRPAEDSPAARRRPAQPSRR